MYTYTRLVLRTIAAETKVYTFARCIRIQDKPNERERENGPRPYEEEHTYTYRNLATYFLLNIHCIIPYSVALGPYILGIHHHQPRSYSRRKTKKTDNSLALYTLRIAVCKGYVGQPCNLRADWLVPNVGCDWSTAIYISIVS